MALHRGIQSAIFYYLSCAPCTEARSRKARKQEALRNKADRSALEAEMPNLYYHPPPSSTNPHWETEIVAGPVLSSRGRRKTAYTLNNESQRRLKSATTRPSDVSNGKPSSTDLASSLGSRDGEREGVPSRRSEDPAWYGTASNERLPSRSTTFSTSTFGAGGDPGVMRPPRAVTRSSERERRMDYAKFSNPNVNDLLPAIATQVTSVDEARSLMMGPPSSEYMAGREDTLVRSRSNSGGSSRLSARSAGVASRDLSRRMFDKKISSRESLSRHSSVRTANNLSSRDTATDAKDFAPHTDHGMGMTAHSDDHSRTMATAIRHAFLAPDTAASHHPAPRRTASRPQLSTIVSSEHVSTADSNSLSVPSPVSRENGDPRPLSPPLFKDVNENGRSLLGSPYLTTNQPSPLRAGSLARASKSSDYIPSAPRKDSKPEVTEFSRTHHPSFDHNAPDNAGLFDSWYTPDFVLPEWIAEHTKREVSQRWSMDF